MTDVGDVQTNAGYSHFYLGKMNTDYQLHVDSYWGDGGDYLSLANGSRFSTFDRDNDGAPQNCAKYFHAAWWYQTNYGPDCGAQSNLFGYYFLGKQELPHFAGPGLSWRPVPGPGGPAIKNVVMKIRPMGYIGGTKDLNNGGGGGDFGGGGGGGGGGFPRQQRDAPVQRAQQRRRRFRRNKRDLEDDEDSYDRSDL